MAQLGGCKSQLLNPSLPQLYMEYLHFGFYEWLNVQMGLSSLAIFPWNMICFSAAGLFEVFPLRVYHRNTPMWVSWNGGTPSHHPFKLYIFLLTIQLWGYPHGYGNPPCRHLLTRCLATAQQRSKGSAAAADLLHIAQRLPTHVAVPRLTHCSHSTEDSGIMSLYI